MRRRQGQDVNESVDSDADDLDETPSSPEKKMREKGGGIASFFGGMLSAFVLVFVVLSAGHEKQQTGLSPVPNARGGTRDATQEGKHQPDGALMKQSPIERKEETTNEPFKEKVFRIKHHSRDSLTSLLWYRGQRFDGKKQLKDSSSNASLTIDTMSIASKSTEFMVEGQAASWGSHQSIRYLFGATEADDDTPYCEANLTVADMYNISEYCSGKAYKRANPKVKYLRNRYPRIDFMQRYKKTLTWFCKHKRFAFAMGKLGRFYRRELESGQFRLPDYLLVQLDDTYYNMINMNIFLDEREPSVSEVKAGCLRRFPKSDITFSFPDPAYGVVVSRAALEQLIRPIHCQDEQKQDEWMKRVCTQLQDNLLGESFAWKEGYSISELMYQHALYFPFQSWRKWRQPGYCVDGDWILGYFVNNYFIGQTEQEMGGSETARIDHELGYNYDKPKGNCAHQGQTTCISEAHVCSKIHAVSMTFLVRQVSKEFPEQFRPAEAAAFRGIQHKRS